MYRFLLFLALTGLAAAQVAPRVNPVDGLKYVWIPPGNFRMGCSLGDSDCRPDEKPAHDVALTKGFWLGETTVTQAAYQRVMGSDPKMSKAGLPAKLITWDNAASYCRKIGGRLPTEAEWEYAARAGTTGARYATLGEIAWYEKNSRGEMHAVGLKKPNAFGLFDMLGNVWQWTADWYSETAYTEAAAQDPAGATGGTWRTLRGGCWNCAAMVVRASSRYVPAERMLALDSGFRCAMN